MSALQPDTQKKTSSEQIQASTGVLIRPVEPSELEEVAWLRAEAYYEDQPHLRYVGSFKRQFKEQEARSLKERTRCRPGSERPECVCFVAVEEAGGSEVVGTLDAEPPGSTTAQHRRIPEGTTYVLNVVVSKKHRKRGIGRALMAAAGKLAKEQWGSNSICTQVSAQNEAALALYKMCGFQESSQDGSLQESAGGSLLGKELFMTAAL
ncbi:g3916 [Coccomyxa elongata]